MKQLEVFVDVNDRDSYHYLLSAVTLKNTLAKANDDGLVLTVKPTYNVLEFPEKNQKSNAELYCLEKMPEYCLNISKFGMFL